ncbi:MAG TPA: hypothetical protein VLT90_11190 [Terriglobales bacterium]|nr:hypothetical protein [Terriglobales bacterium]
MFTGTLIEDLIAIVDRVQARAEAEAKDFQEIEPWFAEMEIAAVDTKLLGVA